MYPSLENSTICIIITQFYSLQWVPEITKNCPKVPFLLVGLKTDIREDPETVNKLQKSKKQPISKEMGTRKGLELKATKYLECSAKTQVLNIASGSEANITTSCEMEIFNFLWLIWDHYLPLAPTKNDRPP